VTTCLEFALDYGVDLGAESKSVKAHMTIAYLNDPEHNSDFYSALDAYVKLTNEYELPVVTVVGYDMFGPKHNVPVLLVEVSDPLPLIAFYLAWGQKEPGMDVFLSRPTFHISLKFADQAPFRDLPVGTQLTPNRMCIKRLGDVPDFYVKEF